MTLRQSYFERGVRGARHRTAFLAARAADRKRARRLSRAILQEHLDDRP